MSFSPVFCLFRGIEISSNEEIKDKFEVFFEERHELFKDYTPYRENSDLTFEDVWDEWNDRGYIIDSEFLDCVYIGEALWTCGEDESQAHEVTPAELLNLDRKNWANLPLEVAEFLLKYFDKDIKTYTILYYI